MGRARDIGDANVMAEMDGVGVSSLFATNTDFELRVCCPSQIDAHLHQNANALSIQNLEGVVMKNPRLGVKRQELVFSIFTRKRVGGLRKIVGAEREEFSKTCKISGTGTGTNGFDHRTKLEG
jgi:hypothetical protein